MAVATVGSGLVILYLRALEYDGTPESPANTTMLVWGNLGLLTLFAGFAGLGFARMGRPRVHRHLMLFAGLSMMGQSLGRLGRFPGLRPSDSFVLNEVLYGLGGLVALRSAVLVHDLVSSRRIHPVTLVGVPTILAVIILAAAWIPGLGPAQALILWVN